MAQLEHTYKAAGVDRDVAEAVKDRIAEIVATTHDPHVTGGPGGFDAMYRLAGYRVTF